MTKWAWLADVGEPREYTLFKESGELVEEDDINYMDGEKIHHAINLNYIVSDICNIIYVIFKLVDINNNDEYWVLANNLFYDSKEICVSCRLQGLQQIKKDDSRINKELDIHLSHAKVVNRQYKLDRLLE